MRFALKSQWKTISVILILVIIQCIFQIEIIDLFSSALKDLKSQKINLLFDDSVLMIVYTICSIILIYVISFLSTKVSVNAAYNMRKKIFHILMNLPEDDINKFKITGLISRSTRGIYSEQGFIILMLEYLLIIPFVFVDIVIEIAFIDRIFAFLFAAFILILALILILRLKQITKIYFEAKKTYGKLNTLFMSKITSLTDNIPFKKQNSSYEFKNACDDSYDKNIKYQLSQYYLGPMLLLVLNIIIVVLLAMMSSGFHIGFESKSVINSVVIMQYLLYFLTTLAVIPTFIERWPRSYATSVRLEEILTLEDKITENNDGNSNKIEIIPEDIENGDRNILVDRKEIIHKFNNILRQHRVKVIVSMILLTVSTLCIVYAPKVAGKTINLIADNADYSNDFAIFTNIALLFVLYFTGFLLKLPSNKFMAFVSEEIAYKLRMELFDKIDVISSSFIRQNSKGHVFSRLNNDLMNIREFVARHVSEIFAQFLSILFVIVMILTTDLRLSMIYLVTLPIYVVCFYLSDFKSKKPYENHQKQLGNMMSYFERSLLNRNSCHEKGFEKINNIVSVNFIKSRNISNAVPPVTAFLTNMSNIAVYIVGFFFLVNKEIQLGTLLAVIIYGQLLTKPLRKVSNSLASLETSFSSIKRIFEIIEFNEDE